MSLEEGVCYEGMTTHLWEDLENIEHSYTHVVPICIIFK